MERLMKRVAVIGGGASGMAAAITAAREGAAVTIIEHTSVLGKKLSATGNGRCNFTNQYLTKDCYRGENPAFWEAIIERFSPQDAIDFFAGLGVLAEDKGGYVYPYSNQAAAVTGALITELYALGVQVCFQTEITRIQKRRGRFFLTGTQWVSVQNGTGSEKKDGRAGGRLQQKKETKEFAMECDRIILSCGSKAAPKTGSDGSGYHLAESLGHRIVPVLPALVQLRCQGDFLKEWSGVRCQGRISLYSHKGLLAEDTGELQLTEYGISGIPVFQVSRFGAEMLSKGRQVTARLNFLPRLDEKEVEKLLRKTISCSGRDCPGKWLSGILPGKLIPVILAQAGITGKAMERRVSSSLTEKYIFSLVQALTDFQIPVTATNTFDQAQVCAGGVDTREVTENCQSKLWPGVYVTGELLDVDGICGGYNLHFAWATGIAAGKSAGRAVQNQT